MGMQSPSHPFENPKNGSLHGSFYQMHCHPLPSYPIHCSQILRQSQQPKCVKIIKMNSLIHRQKSSIKKRVCSRFSQLTDGNTYLGVSSPAYPAFTWYVPTSRTMAFTSSAKDDQMLMQMRQDWQWSHIEDWAIRSKTAIQSHPLPLMFLTSVKRPAIASLKNQKLFKQDDEKTGQKAIEAYPPAVRS